MKKLLPLTALILIIYFITSCTPEDSTPKVDKNGLTKEITDLVPKYILDEMKELGMPINGGGDPPFIEGTYFVSPFILVSSNRAGDTRGDKFADYKVNFVEEYDDLTIVVDYENGPESGSGLTSFIVGDGNNFSVFVEINSTHIGGSTAKFIHVLSGKRVNNGIENFYYSNFMIDNNGNPQNVWIENGEGRVIYDQDGFSERL